MPADLEINFINLDSYSFTKRPIGHAYIFSNKIFDSPEYPVRHATVHDEIALKILLNKMGLVVEEPFKNMTANACREKLKAIASREDLPDEECMLMAFISHGELNKIRMKDIDIDVEQIMEEFTEDNCQYLMNKPKIFIFQTCRGTKMKVNDSPDETDAGESSPTIDEEEWIKQGGADPSLMPKGADFIACYPTLPGYVSYQSPQYGSLFIQRFTDVFDAYLNDESKKKIDFTTLLAIVSHEISNRESDASQNTNNPTQMPWFFSTLRKQLFLSKIIEQRQNVVPESDETFTEVLRTEEVDVGPQVDNQNQSNQPSVADERNSFLTKFKLESYPLNEKHIGHAYIFSNKSFDHPEYGKRRGNKYDVNLLQQLLKNMGFTVKVLKNMRDDQCLKKLNDISSKQNRSKDSCLLMAFLSHGDLNEVRMRNGGISLKSIMEKFTEDNCTYMKNKPKIFVFQTCRGGKTDNCVEHQKTHCKSTSFAESDAGPIIEEENKLYLETVGDGESYMPKGADFMCCYATSPGYVSYRHPKTGSYFIQGFENIDAYIKDESRAEVDFINLMTLVAKRVSEKTTESETVRNKQMPWFSSTLRKSLYFPKANKRQNHQNNCFRFW